MPRKAKEMVETETETVESPTDVGELSLPQQAEHLGGLQFTIEETETVIGQPLKGELLTAYRRGTLLEEAKVREAIKRLAIRGSSPAQKQYVDLTEQTKRANRRRRRPPK